MNIRRTVGFSALCLGLAVASRASADGGTGSTLTEDASSYTALFTGQELISDSGYYHLMMQGDGNLVEYANCGNNTAVWINGMNGTGGNDVSSPWVAFQQDGNFVEYSWRGEVIWASDTPTGNNSHLWLQDDGNLVIYPGQGSWATGPHGWHDNPLCPETASHTTVWPTWRPTTENGSYGSAAYNFGQCGNACATDSRCVMFSWRQGFPIDGQCTVYSSVPGAWTRDNAWSAGIITRVRRN